MEKETNYLVLEVHNAYAVVLDNSGRFIKAANCGYEVGDTVDSIIPMIYPQDKKKRTNNIIRLAASLAACICLCVFGIYEYQFMYTEYGSVHMQINPEVEITLSRSGRVLDIEGENADGKELVKDYEYKGKDKETVVDELADLAIEQQYLADAGRISIEVDARSDEWVRKMETELSKELNSYLQGQGITIEVIVGPMEDEDDTESKEILEKPQSVTIPIPEMTDQTDDSAAGSDYSGDDGVTDYAAPSGTTSAPAAPSSSAPAPAPVQSDPGDDSGGDSSYGGGDNSDDSSGNSPYDSQGNSSYGDSSYSGSDGDNDDDD